MTGEIVYDMNQQLRNEDMYANKKNLGTSFFNKKIISTNNYATQFLTKNCDHNSTKSISDSSDINNQ